MIIASFGTSPKDDRPQMLVGITLADLTQLVSAGVAYLNHGEPEGEKQLPVHLILMFDQDDSALNARLEKIVEKAEASIAAANDTAECDHDWEHVGNGVEVCTYPDCNAERHVGDDTESPANGDDDLRE